MHNKLVLNYKGKKYISYNNMLPFVLDAINEGLLFTSHLAIGSSGKETALGQEHLYDYKLTLETETVASNFDPQKGELFVTKRAVIESEHPLPLEIMEIGLTPFASDKNPKIVNRFVLSESEPIIRDKGDEISFEVTIYLGLSDNSTLKLTGGENNLVKRLLGELEENNLEWSLAKGDNATINSSIISREDFEGRQYPSNVSIIGNEDLTKLTISISGSIGAGVVQELLVLYGGEVVMRLNAAEVFGGDDSGGEFTGVVDNDKSLSILVSAVKELSSVTTASGEEITGYTTSNFGTGFSYVDFDPFHGRHFPYSYNHYIN